MHLLLGFLFKISHFWLPIPVEKTYLTNGKMGRKDEPELQRWGFPLIVSVNSKECNVGQRRWSGACHLDQSKRPGVGRRGKMSAKRC